MAFDPTSATLADNADAAPAFDPMSATLVDEGTPSAPPSPTVYDPTEGMSGVDKFLAGAGKSFVDTGRGAYQIGASLGHAMGLVSDDKMKEIQSDVDESKHLDAPLMSTGAGVAGNITGGMAQMALAPAVTPAALGAVPLLADTTASAAFSGLQPTASGESRLKNTALGAGAGAVGSAAGKAVGWLAQPLRSAMSEAGNSAVDTLTEAGIPLDLAQQTGSRVAKTLKNIVADNPIIGPSAFPEEQGAAFNRAALRTMGVTDPAVTVADSETMGPAKKAITDVMDRVASNTKVKYDPELESALSDIAANAPGRASADDLGPVYHNINNILESAVNNNGVIPGKAYQRINTNLGGLTSNPANGDIIGDIQEALHIAGGSIGACNRSPAISGDEANRGRRRSRHGQYQPGDTYQSNQYEDQSQSSPLWCG